MPGNGAAGDTPAQTLVCTVLPNGVDADSLHVSVLLSPRFTGGDTLAAFPDWLTWTRLLQNGSPQMTLNIAGTDVAVAVPTTGLRPDIWEAIFRPESRVTPYQFDDYTERLIISNADRDALATLKALYGIAGVQAALPPAGGGGLERRYRTFLANLLQPFQAPWNARVYEAQRARLRDAQSSGVGDPSLPAGRMGADGLPALAQMPDSGRTQSMVTRWALSQYLPDAPNMVRPPLDQVLDVHRALTALTSYPQVMRALGLVLDVDVPREGVSPTGPDGSDEIYVSALTLTGVWAVPTALSTPHTAYRYEERVNLALFLPAPRAPSQDYGLLHLDPGEYGLGQVDVDGALHKLTTLADTIDNLAVPPHPEVFDPAATLPSLRSSGLSLIADNRALHLLQAFHEASAFNDALESGGAFPRPFYAGDLVRGYRLDIWDSATGAWHSLHRRDGSYLFGEAQDLSYTTVDEEGFTQLAVTQAAPDPSRPAPDDLYLTETIARWSGWSLSAPRPGKNLSRSSDAAKAVPPDDPKDPNADEENAPATPFKMRASFRVRPGTLPRLRFGRRYRLRARLVDLAGNSVLPPPAPLTDALAGDAALPLDQEGVAYLRYEPVPAPVLVLRDQEGVTGPGSAIDRLVIRTYNSDPSLDTRLADLTAGDRHVAPPKGSVEMAERHGLFDDPATGAMMADAATRNLIAQRDAGSFATAPVALSGQTQPVPIEPVPSLAGVPYLPDPLARGAALRNLPGAPEGTLGTLGPSSLLAYALLPDAHHRPGSATLLSFGGEAGWQQERPFRLALGDGSGQPAWDPAQRLLTVFLPKATLAVVPLTSWIAADDLKLMGVWQWLREAAEAFGLQEAERGASEVRLADLLARIVGLAMEGGHWMLTPPRLLTLVHAVQQPIGSPCFVALAAERTPPDPSDPAAALAMQPESVLGPDADTAFDPITAWRAPGAVDAYLVGGLRVHGDSTVKIDILAEWDDPVDDPANPGPTSVHLSQHVDELPLHDLASDWLRATGPADRYVGYYRRERDVIWFAAPGERLDGVTGGVVAAPRHHLNDARHHVVHYRAVATSRFREYFDNTAGLDFTRTSEPVTVDVPASVRPAAPSVVYALPTFGWERQTTTNLKSSVRFGGGLRIYLNRPWFSSGAGELLGVTLWPAGAGAPSDAAREAWKPMISQWGVDPIWQTDGIPPVPSVGDFPRAVTSDLGLSLDELTDWNAAGQPIQTGTVDVAGHEVHFDAQRDLWYCDLTIDTPTYTPFVRLALARYQPHALDDARLSRVILADFVQLTPDRAATVTADPYHPRRLHVTVSGPGPRGPRQTTITVTVQEQHAAIQSDLAWADAAAADVQVVEDLVTPAPDVALWTGTVEFAAPPEVGRYRLVVREYEYLQTDAPVGERALPLTARLVYAEIIGLDGPLVAAPPAAASSTSETATAPPGLPPLPDTAAPGWEPLADAPLAPVRDYRQLPVLQQVADLTVVDPYVKLAQALLNAAGALPPLAVDGKFGPNTDVALRAFQGTHFLPVDGMLDTANWYALALTSPMPQLEPGLGTPPMTGPPIAVAQELLGLAGISPRPDVTGVYDTPTQAAVSNLQDGQGLPNTGVVDPLTWLALITQQESSTPTATMKLTFSYDSEQWHAGQPPLQFVSRVDLDATAPVSADLSPSTEVSGFWYELQDANGQPLYRQDLERPVHLFTEVQSDAPAAPLQTFPLASTSGSFTILAPLYPTAQTLVFVSSPLDPDHWTEAAGVIASFALSDIPAGPK